MFFLKSYSYITQKKRNYLTDLFEIFFDTLYNELTEDIFFKKILVLPHYYR